MKVTNRTIFECQRALPKLARQPLVGKTSYWVGRYVERISRLIKSIDAERMELVKKYGTKNDQGITVEDDKMPDFTKDFDTILDTEIEIDIKKIAFEQLGNIQLSGEEAVALSFILEEPKENA